MNKKLLLSLATIAALTAVSTTTFAAEDKNSGTEANTDIGIGFGKGPNAGTDGPFKDNLAMVFRPENFKFGTKNAAGSNANTFSNQTEGRQYLVVNDDRNDESKGQGWTMTGQMTALKSGTTELTNAKLSFGSDSSSLFTYTLGTEYDEVKQDYIPAEVNDNADGSQAASLAALAAGEKDKYITPVTTLQAGGGAVEVFQKTTADSQKGGVAYQMENVKLNIVNDSSLAGKQFVGSVTWVLGKDVKP